MSTCGMLWTGYLSYQSANQGGAAAAPAAAKPAAKGKGKAAK